MESGQGPARWVLADLGNSRCKLALGERRKGGAWQVRALGDWAHEGGNQWESLDTIWEAQGLGQTPALISSVAGQAATGHLAAALENAGAPAVHTHPDPGLVLAVRHPETVGFDRLYGARAAFERAGKRSAIVVDAGTALTVDAVRPDPETGRPTFLGGAIAPGPELLSRALSGGAAQLHDIDPEPGVPALGQDTAAALRAGVVVGFEGAAKHLVCRVRAEAELAGAAIVLTGGAAHFLRTTLEELAGGLIEDPVLVPRGLAFAFGDTLPNADG